MINPAKYLISRLYRLRNAIRCNIQRRQFMASSSKDNYKGKAKVTELDLSVLGNTLIIVPHADDELIGCLGILKKTDKNVWLYYIGHYPIVDEKLRLTRDNELLSLSKKLGIDLIRHDDDISNFINAINEHKIKSVFTPDFVDWHEDHQNASLLLKESIPNLDHQPDIYTYSVTVPFKSHGQLYALPYTRQELSEKWNLFYEIYRSQNFMPVCRFKNQERINAIGLDNAYAAELFRKVSVREFMAAADNRPQKDERTHIYSLINSITDIRSYVNK